MGNEQRPADLQEAVERSFRAQWGGKRFYLTTAIVFFVLAVVGAIALVVAHTWFKEPVLRVIEVSALTTSFVCLIAAVLFALEALMRSQRESGQVPDRTIHAALCLSVITVAGILFLFFLLFVVPWDATSINPSVVQTIRFIIFIFSGFVWLGSVVMNSAGITVLVTRRSEMLEVNNTTKGTSLFFKRGYSSEIVKLSIAAVIPLIIFVIAVLMAGFSLPD